MRVAFLGRSPPRTAESPRRSEVVVTGPHGLGRRGGVSVFAPLNSQSPATAPDPPD
jgi:hypothetical protein